MSSEEVVPSGALCVKTESSLSDDENKANLKTPLAAMLPKEYEKVNVREWFPEFRPGQVRNICSIVNLCVGFVFMYSSFVCEVKRFA